MSTTPYPDFGILLVDDEPDWLGSLSLTLESCAGISNISTCSDSRQVMDILDRGGFGLVLLDLTMTHLSGEDLLEKIAERHPEIVTIVISGLNQIETAVRCMRKGAFDYFVKTDDQDRMIAGVLRAVRMQELQRDHREMASRLNAPEIRHPEAFEAIVTNDRGMRALFAYVEAIAKSPQPLLITGESGVGKELIARAAHSLSGCRGKLVTVNVAGLDDTVFADTLFGHLRGAYTGAEQARRGMVEEAADGTLFLDEIGDLSIPSQVKLLRLLQEGEYFQLGSDLPKRIKARIIVATHQNLADRETARADRFTGSGCGSSCARDRILRITSPLTVLSNRACVQALATASSPYRPTAERMPTNWRSPPERPSKAVLTEFIASGRSHRLNGAPFRNAPGFCSRTAR